LGGPRPRAVLALLVLEAGRVAPAGRLVEEVWRGSPPPGAAKTLRLEAYRFRRQLYYATCAILVSIPSSYSEGVRYPSPF
jgi:DNA-binding SARP family transcriptional activator